MKLYYAKGACSLAVRIVINELKLTCEFESVNLKTKQTETGKDFLTINPKGSVPTFVTDKNEILTENVVIQQYLADTYNATELLPPIGNFKRYRVLEWANFVTTELHKGFGPLFNLDIPQTVKNEIFIPILKKKFAYVDAHLHDHRYLAGDNFTLPDGYLFVVLNWVTNFKIDLAEWPHLANYFNELKKRKSIEHSLTEEGLI